MSNSSQGNAPSGAAPLSGWNGIAAFKGPDGMRFLFESQADPSLHAVIKLFDYRERAESKHVKVPATLKFWYNANLSRTTGMWNMKPYSASRSDWALARETFRTIGRLAVRTPLRFTLKEGVAQ